MVLFEDHDVAFAQHRDRVKKAVTKIDSKPPRVHAGNYLKLRNLKDDASNYQRILKHNMQLMISMNGIQRTTGKIQTFQRCYACELQRSNLPYMINDMLKLEKRNYAFGRRLLGTKAVLETRRPSSTKDNEKRLQTEVFELPQQILSKYENLKLPRSIAMARKLLRPKIFFDLAIARIWMLGRVVIQLYTEACPQVVLEFMQCCKAYNTDRFSFIHLFPSLWLEGQLRIEGKSLNTTKIEYDMRALDHGKSAGILSFPGNCIQGFSYGCIDFAISFRPLAVLNGKRVGFGRVLQGMKLLSSLSNYGTKSGRPHKQIVLVKCGVLN